MKRILTFLIFLTLAFPVFSKEYKVHGPQGGLAMELTLPDDFNEDTDKCPMVILMHGIFSSKNIVPIPALAKALAKEGIASICFDFGGHWKSEGKMERTAKAYTGPVRLIHGSKDTIVPMSCSERFVETYTQDAELVVVEGENHMITRRLKTVVSHAVSFFASIYRTFQVNVYENFKQAFALYRFGGDIERMRDCKNLWPIHFRCSHHVPC